MFNCSPGLITPRLIASKERYERLYFNEGKSYIRKHLNKLGTLLYIFCTFLCIFGDDKQYFCTLCTCIFHLLTFCRRSPAFFLRREITCFAVERTRRAYDDKCSILSSYVSRAGSKFNSRIVSLNN